jgi:hypothetical protein
MTDIRIVVLLTEANPELVAEFEGLPPRARAERLRILATLGLRSLGVAPQGSSPKMRQMPAENGAVSPREDVSGGVYDGQKPSENLSDLQSSTKSPKSSGDITAAVDEFPSQAGSDSGSANTETGINGPVVANPRIARLIGRFPKG